jgi:hypothetical protein
VRLSIRLSCGGKGRSQDVEAVYPSVDSLGYWSWGCCAYGGVAAESWFLFDLAGIILLPLIPRPVFVVLDWVLHLRYSRGNRHRTRLGLFARLVLLGRIELDWGSQQDELIMLLRTGVNGQGWRHYRAIRRGSSVDRPCYQVLVAHTPWCPHFIQSRAGYNGILIYMKYLDAFLRVLNLWLCSVDFGLEYRYRLRRCVETMIESQSFMLLHVVCSCASFRRIHDGFWIGTRLISSNIQQVWCVWARSWMSICFIVFKQGA